MGSRPSKLPSLRHSSQSHVSREDATLPNGVPFAVKPPDLSVAPRSIVSFPRVPEQPENGYFTPRSRGRSAIYRMSRSPYFKVPAKAETKVFAFSLWVKQLSSLGAYLFSNSGFLRIVISG